MRWLIDGYNVIRADADLKSREAESLEAGRTALLHLLSRVARDSPDDFTVVFDGAGRGLEMGSAAGARVSVLFSPGRQKADDVLMRLARELGNGAIVVTSDRTIQDAARRASATALGAGRFLEALDATEATEAMDDEDDDEEPDASRGKRGNPHRLSRDARAVERALRRLRRR